MVFWVFFWSVFFLVRSCRETVVIDDNSSQLAPIDFGQNWPKIYIVETKYAAKYFLALCCLTSPFLAYQPSPYWNSQIALSLDSTSRFIPSASPVLSRLTSLFTCQLINTAQHQTITQQYGDWYTGRWWLGCYIWYSEEGPEWAGAPPSPLLAVPTLYYYCRFSVVVTHSGWWK